MDERLNAAGGEGARMIVLFPQWNGAWHSSMGVYLKQVSEELLDRGVHTVTASPGAYRTAYAGALGRPAWVPRTLLRLADLRLPWPASLYLFDVACRLGGRPRIVSLSQEYVPFLSARDTVVIVHDLIQLRHPRSGVVRILYQFARDVLIPRCRGVIAVSRTTARELSDAGIQSRVVYNRFDRPAAPRGSTIRGGPDFLWVGTEAAHKRLDWMIAAMSHNPDARCTVVLPSLPSAPLPPNMTVRVGLSDAEMAEAYASHGTFVSTSAIEGYGRPAMEARMTGSDLLLSDIDIYRELHGGVARFISSAEALTVAVGEIAARPPVASSPVLPSQGVAAAGELASAILDLHFGPRQATA